MIVCVAGIITDLIAANRVLLEEVRMRLIRAEITASPESTIEQQAAPERTQLAGRL